MFLRNDEIALISSGKIEVFDQSSTLVEKDIERFAGGATSISKNGYPHFMLKEIFEQPQTIQQAFHNRLIPDFGTAEFENLTFSPSELLAVRRIVILACGTSWHAGQIAASLLEDKARIPTQAEIASEFRYKNPIISRRYPRHRHQPIRRNPRHNCCRPRSQKQRRQSPRHLQRPQTPP